MVSYFPEKWFPPVCRDIATIVSVYYYEPLSVSFDVFSVFIPKALRTFLLYMFGITATVLGWIQMNCPWHSLMRRMTPRYLLCWLAHVQCYPTPRNTPKSAIDNSAGFPDNNRREAKHAQMKCVWSPGEINRLKTLNETDKTFTVLNRDNGNYITTNSWTPPFRKIGNH